MSSPSAPQPARRPAIWNKEPLLHVKRTIAVASGKGGVGKSTLTVNLAHSLRDAGKKTGILDADIYGPSIPRMLGVSGKPEFEENKMIPLMGHGIACMSIGFITGDEAAILRGPMISKALTQLLRMTRWGTQAEPMDTLLIDMPPGTGDVHLSMAQLAPLTGAVIVTTPQEVALADARKAAIMFQKVSVPLLGVVENMSGGMFGSGGGQKLADEFQVPLLGVIPMDADICKAGDMGSIYAGSCAKDYLEIAKKINSLG